MENKIINIATVAEVAEALKELKDQMVFIGGAIISVYTDDVSADEIRPTADVDLTINLLNYADWAQMLERLADLGFSPDPNGPSICRYLYKDIAVDIMPAKDSSIGPANKWYTIGFENLWPATVKGQNIRVFSAPCYLATKFEAFNDRGTDYRTSHDFEDIIYVLDNRTTIVEEIENDHSKIKQFLKEELIKIQQSTNFIEIISCHIHPLIVTDRLPLLKEKIERIINS
ncbi:hypothetical protein [Maribacter sp. 2308TA10-17]|uniref:hypothetical protein n=1 Tax=Maribacter sp. 2308TA10-17 TaxID=3386276 RepID=UPI0039BCA685